jgi:hypothetical protein
MDLFQKCLVAAASNAAATITLVGCNDNLGAEKGNKKSFPSNVPGQ